MDQGEKPQDKDTQTSQEAEAKPVDWKAHAQKWEARAKANHKRLGELEQAIKDAEDSKEQAVKDALGPIKTRLEAMQKAEQVRCWRDEVAESYNIPAKLLHGQTLEEIKTNAETLTGYLSSQGRGPVVRDAGKTPSKTKNSELDTVRALFGNH